MNWELWVTKWQTSVPGDLLGSAEAGVLRHSIVASVALLGLVVLMAVGTVVLRVWHMVGERRLEQKKLLWRRLYFRFLADPQDTGLFHGQLPPGDFLAFGQFIHPYLLDILGQEREQLIRLLQGLGFDAFLLDKLARGQEWERVFAVNFLGLMGNPAHVPTLRGLLHDSSRLVRHQAASVLMGFKDIASVRSVLSRFCGPDWAGEDQVLLLLMNHGQETLGELGAMLRAGDLSVREIRVVLKMFQQFNCTEMTWDMVSLYGQLTDRETRLVALSALESFEDPFLAGFFETQLADADAAVRAIAARALGKVGDETVVAVLSQHLAEDEFWVVKHTAWALAQLGEAGMKALRNAQTTHTEDVAQALIREAVFNHEHHRPG